MTKYFFITIFLSIFLICMESHAFTCHIVKTENGEHRFKYSVEWGRRSNGIEGALFKIYGNPKKIIEYAGYRDCSASSSGYYCVSRRWDDIDEIQVVKKDDDYIVTASTYGPKTPKHYYVKNEYCTLAGGN